MEYVNPKTRAELEPSSSQLPPHSASEIGKQNTVAQNCDEQGDVVTASHTIASTEVYDDEDALQKTERIKEILSVSSWF